MPGSPVYYRIQPLIVVNQPLSDGTANWQLQRTTTPSSPSNQVTPCAPPAPDQAMLFGSVASFVSYHPYGADEMELEVQRDQGNGSPVDFAPANTYTQIASGLNPALSYDAVTIQVPLASLQALPGTGDVYWWRVGANNRGDSVKPLSVAAYPHQ